MLPDISVEKIAGCTDHTHREHFLCLLLGEFPAIAAAVAAAVLEQGALWPRAWWELRGGLEVGHGLAAPRPALQVLDGRSQAQRLMGPLAVPDLVAAMDERDEIRGLPDRRSPLTLDDILAMRVLALPGGGCGVAIGMSLWTLWDRGQATVKGWAAFTAGNIA